MVEASESDDRPVDEEMITAIIRRVMPAPLYPYCRLTRRKAHAYWRRIDYTLDRRTRSRDVFTTHLQASGMSRGATVYIHSSMNEIRCRVPSLEPMDLIDLLKGLVGEEGTILLPTFPLRGLQYHYVQEHRCFDVKRTPSQVGLLTEIYRRSKGVTRSLHPIHPIAAWGKYSKELLAQHHLGTAFGETSPLYKMQQHNGVVVGLG